MNRLPNQKTRNIVGRYRTVLPNEVIKEEKGIPVHVDQKEIVETMAHEVTVAQKVRVEKMVVPDPVVLPVSLNAFASVEEEEEERTINAKLQKLTCTTLPNFY